jgi:hypothetical protein
MWTWQRHWRRRPLLSGVINYIRRSSVFFFSLYSSFVLTGLLIDTCTSLAQFSHYQLPESFIFGCHF